MSIKKIVVLIFVLVVMIYVDYRMFFADYSQKSFVTTTGYLSKRPEFHKGTRQSSRWLFYMNNRIFELRKRHLLGITIREIFQLSLKDKITFYTYKNSNFADFINNRTRIFGIETKQFKKFRYKKVRDEIRGLDVNGFWVVNFISLIVLLAMFSKTFYRFFSIEDSSM